MLTPEHLVVVVFLGGVAVGYLLALLFPLEALRELIGVPVPQPPPGEDLRQAMRLVLEAPPSASDADLVAGLFDLRRQAKRQPTRETP